MNGRPSIYLILFLVLLSSNALAIVIWDGPTLKMEDEDVYSPTGITYPAEAISHIKLYYDDRTFKYGPDAYDKIAIYGVVDGSTTQISGFVFPEEDGHQFNVGGILTDLNFQAKKSSMVLYIAVERIVDDRDCISGVCCNTTNNTFITDDQSSYSYNGDAWTDGCTGANNNKLINYFCDGTNENISQEYNGIDNDSDLYDLECGDADDSDDTIYPGAPELCDGKDNDQNTILDDGCDDDLDGFCDIDKTYVKESTAACTIKLDPQFDIDLYDCDDTNPNINPDAADLCGNNINENCNLYVDEGYYQCGDLYGSEIFSECIGKVWDTTVMNNVPGTNPTGVGGFESCTFNIGDYDVAGIYLIGQPITFNYTGLPPNCSGCYYIHWWFGDGSYACYTNGSGCAPVTGTLNQGLSVTHSYSAAQTATPPYGYVVKVLANKGGYTSQKQRYILIVDSFCPYGCELGELCSPNYSLDPVKNGCCDPLTDLDCFSDCTSNGACDPWEGCGCADCTNNQDNCASGFTCVSGETTCQCDNASDGYCPKDDTDMPICDDDPDCGCWPPCGIGEVCGADGLCCDPADLLCLPSCDDDGICEEGEACSCSDCTEAVNFTDSCAPGMECIQVEEISVCGCTNELDGVCPPGCPDPDCGGCTEDCDLNEICGYDGANWACCDPILDPGCIPYCDPVPSGVCDVNESCGCPDCAGEVDACAEGLACGIVDSIEVCDISDCLTGWNVCNYAGGAVCNGVMNPIDGNCCGACTIGGIETCTAYGYDSLPCTVGQECSGGSVSPAIGLTCCDGSCADLSCPGPWRTCSGGMNCDGFTTAFGCCGNCVDPTAPPGGGISCGNYVSPSGIVYQSCGAGETCIGMETIDGLECCLGCSTPGDSCADPECQPEDYFDCPWEVYLQQCTESQTVTMNGIKLDMTYPVKVIPFPSGNYPIQGLMAEAEDIWKEEAPTALDISIDGVSISDCGSPESIGTYKTRYACNWTPEPTIEDKYEVLGKAEVSVTEPREAFLKGYITKGELLRRAVPEVPLVLVPILLLFACLIVFWPRKV